MTSEETAFRAAIVAEPEDDTRRLGYADWLDENAGDKACAKCGGEGAVAADGRARAYQLSVNCGACVGTGRVPDDGRERAEYIRFAIAGHLGDDASANTADLLLAAHEADWRRAGPCPACKGRRELIHPVSTGVGVKLRPSGSDVSPGDVLFRQELRPCAACFGTGDAGGLLRRMHLDDPENGLSPVDLRTPPPVTFRRGFPDAVHCRLADVVRRECRDCGGIDRHGYAECPGELTWRITPWAKAVVTWHPVRAFVVTDRTPYHNGAGYCFYNLSLRRANSTIPEAAELPAAASQAYLEECARSGLPGKRNGRWASAPTRDAANDALHTALARLARRAANLTNPVVGA